MKTGKPLFLLLPLALLLLIPSLAEAFWKIPIKKPNLDPKILAQLDTFTSDATKSLEEMNKSVVDMAKQRRQSICCYEVANQADEQTLLLRSAVYTTIVALSRLQDATSAYRQQLNDKCNTCDVLPGEALCGEEEYPCPSEPKKCVNGTQMCDGKPDCSDGSDEEFQICFKSICEFDAICEEEQVCIPSSYRCDGRRDCPDGSDETVCNVPHTDKCEDDQFKCVSDDNCVPDSWRCDGADDCDDGSDEASCPTTGPAPTPYTCRDDQFKCVTDDNCVPDSFLCDGDEDCSDGSDEASCPTTGPSPTPYTCEDGQFKCVSHDNCVPDSWRCDGADDCDDGSDEASCPTIPEPGCGADELRCISSGDCLPGSFRCDGDTDCADGSDEKDCSTVKAEPCEENPCSHKCEPAPWTNKGFYCSCPKGMTLRLPDEHNCVAAERKGIKGAISGTSGIKG